MLLLAAMSNDQTGATLRYTVQTALFAALIAVGAYIAIPVPISPVPLVLQNMLVMLAGVLLGPGKGVLAVALYLGMGTIGLPVFAGGSAGPATFIGPTGGYLAAYLPAAALAGALARRFPTTRGVLAAAGLAAALILIVGASWLAVVGRLTPPEALIIGVLPFLPGDIVKVLAAAAIWRRLHTQFEESS